MSHPFAAEIAAHESELDAIHPGWRSPVRAKRRFDAAPIAKMRRIKWLLLRLKHLRDGRADWIVKIVDEGTPPRRCFAHSIPPKVEPNAGIMGEPPVWAMPVSPPCLPVPPPVAPDVIAVMLATGRPLEMVEAALAVMPEGADPVAWVNAQTVTMLSGGQMAIIHASEVSP